MTNMSLMKEIFLLLFDPSNEASKGHQIVAENFTRG